MKTKSKLLQPIWQELCDIFIESNGCTRTKELERLERLGFRVEHGKKHPKMYIVLDKEYCITLSGSPSDYNSGRQTLRRIRKIYERYENER